MPSTSTRSFAKISRLALGAAALLLPPFVTASAQFGRTEALETRAVLTERAERLERSGQRGQAASIRARLEEGDFLEGDRVVILLQNNPALLSRPADAATLMRPDTLVVRAGRVLQFPPGRYTGVADLPVGGLLRSEIAEAVRKQFAVVYRDPQLRVVPLVQLSVTGAVLRSGFVDVPGDMKISDVFTQAGGLATDADMKKAFIRRGAQIILEKDRFQEALDNGITVDAAQLRAGDQISVPHKSASNWLAYAGFAMSLLGVVVALSRR